MLALILAWPTAQVSEGFMLKANGIGGTTTTEAPCHHECLAYYRSLFILSYTAMSTRYTPLVKDSLVLSLRLY